MKILITGGAGFIGSHLSEKLLQDGHKVTVIDNLSTGQLENISNFKDHPDFELVVGSVLEENLIRKKTKGKDRIYHLAAAVGVQNIIDQPLESIEVNVDGTQNVLRAANREKIPTFIASTSEVYGKNENIPFEETDDRVTGSTTISRWSYSCTKALDEFLSIAYWREKQLPVVIARFFNTVGPRQTGQYGMVIPRFVKQALLGRPLTVYGDGQQTRVFLDVADAVKAARGLMDTEEAYGQPVNIGGNDRISIEQLAENIIDVVGSDSSIEYIPYDEAYEKGFEDMRHRQPDVSRLRKLVGFDQQYSTKEILQRVVDYFRSNEDFP
ncbi:MAG: GDP-mannose 4,6-dehydratase [bacterium]